MTTKPNNRDPGKIKKQNFASISKKNRIFALANVDRFVMIATTETTQAAVSMKHTPASFEKMLKQHSCQSLFKSFTLLSPRRNVRPGVNV